MKRKARESDCEGLFGNLEVGNGYLALVEPFMPFFHALKNRSCLSYKHPLVLAQHNSIYRHVLCMFLTALQGVKSHIAGTDVHCHVSHGSSRHANHLKYYSACEPVHLDRVSRPCASLKLTL